MKRILQSIAVIALGLTVLPAFLVFRGAIEWETHAMLMLVGTVLWFAVAPAAMGSGRGSGDNGSDEMPG